MQSVGNMRGCSKHSGIVQHGTDPLEGTCGASAGRQLSSAIGHFPSWGFNAPVSTFLLDTTLKSTNRGQRGAFAHYFPAALCKPSPNDSASASSVRLPQTRLSYLPTCLPELWPPPAVDVARFFWTGEQSARLSIEKGFHASRLKTHRRCALPAPASFTGCTAECSLISKQTSLDLLHASAVSCISSYRSSSRSWLVIPFWHGDAAA